MSRTFQFIGGTSEKFWTIELSGAEHTVTYGRIGTSGQSKTKEFASAAEALKSHDKLVAEKLKDGYVETTPGASATSAVATPPVAKPASSTAATKTATKPTLKAAKARPVAAQVDDVDEASSKPATSTPAPLAAQALPVVFPASRIVLDPVEWYVASWRDLPSLPRTPATKTFAALEKGFGWQQRPGLVPLEWGTPREHFQHLIDHHGDDVLDRVLLEFFPTRIRPYLTSEELSELQEMARAEIAKHPPQTVDVKKACPHIYLLAALVGCHEEVEALVSRFPDGRYTMDDRELMNHEEKAVFLLSGLDSAAKYLHHARRLKVISQEEDDLRAWLACTELAALDVLEAQILNSGLPKAYLDTLMKEFARVEAPEAAVHMLHLANESRAPKRAREWLQRHPGHAIRGLAKVAAGNTSRAAEAIAFLRDKKTEGQTAALEHAIQELPPAEAEKLKREMLDWSLPVFNETATTALPAELQQEVAAALKLKPTKGSEFVILDKLPPLMVNGGSLGPDVVRAIWLALQHHTPAAPQPLLAQVRQLADSHSRDAFAWNLFEQWLQEGAPSKHRWAMGALGLLGDDGVVLKLTPLVRAWPGESQHQRAVFGLECLRQIGSDLALMQLNGIAQKLKFKALKQKANDFMESIAKDKGLTADELSDRIVPDFDLDARGTRVFDFGPRKFQFVLGPQQKPKVRDDAGKLKDDLPKPGAKDDAELAGAAVADWKLLKKQLREVLKTQIERLEKAMIVGRRWSVADFDLLLVKHPLMINLIQLLLWGGYDAAGKLVRSFRITAEQELTDVDDNPISLDSIKTVGIVHPLHLTEQERQRWGEVFSDYELIPPFAQLGRRVYTLEAGEDQQTSFTRLLKYKIESVVMVGMLERLGWTRGIPEDGGVYHEHSKPFPSANVTAIFQYEMGVPVGFIQGWEDQTVTDCFLVPGVYTPRMYSDHKKRVKLGDVDPVVLSEMIGDLSVLKSKAI